MNPKNRRMSFLSESNTKELEELWALWNSATNLELEATFPTDTYAKWKNVVQSLREFELREIPAPPKLNIMLERGLRITIVGQGPIDMFCEKGVLEWKGGKIPYHVILKQKQNDQKINVTPDEVYLPEYGVKVKLRREIELSNDDGRVRSALASWATSLKSFRYIERSSFVMNANPGVQYDASKIRESKKDETKRYVLVRTIQESGVLEAIPRYEMEAEALRAQEGSKGLKGFLIAIKTVLRGLQRCFVLVPRSIRQSVIREIATITGVDERSFVGSQPAPLLIENMATEKTVGTPNIRFDDYNVTDKADGERCLLYVRKDGTIYLTDRSQNVYGTDRKLSPEHAELWAGTVLDGEWIHQNAKKERVSYYYAFDIFNGKKGVDVSTRPFFVRTTGAETRLLAMQEAIAILRNATFTIAGLPGDSSLMITMKVFQPVVDPLDPNGIFREAKSVMERLSENPPYHTDGLIFTPNKIALPKGGSWRAQLKWKPAEENTVDFLVKAEKETHIRLIKDNPVLCKTLHLYVGSSANPALADPRKVVLEMLPLPTSTEKIRYQPQEFVTDPYDSMAAICYSPVEDEIPDNSIVEMAYDLDEPAGFRWSPLRIRWDKTAQYQERGQIGGTLNSDETAQSVWNSIHDPITVDMIQTGSLYERTTDLSKLYYKVDVSSEEKQFTKGLQKFHNQYIKNQILLQSTLRSFTKPPTLLDMSCGKGGDLLKWMDNRVGFVLGCDIAESGLINPKDSIYKRYVEFMMKRGREKVPPMIFLQADASKLYEDGTAGMTPDDRRMLRAVWGHAESGIPPAVKTVEGIASAGFDVVSMMFTLHFMFRDRSMFDGWLLNLASSLKVGGYFVGCCFDGDTVAKKLQSIKEGDTLRGTTDGSDVWSITKRYDDSNTGLLPSTEEGLGRTIDVYFASIGETYPEYLMSFPYLQRRLEDIGCQLLTEEECSSLGLEHSTAMFETSYTMAKDHGVVFPMDSVLKEYSYLNRWFIFKRRTDSVKSPSTSSKAIPSIIVGELEDEPEAPVNIVEHEEEPLEDLPVLTKPTPTLVIRELDKKPAKAETAVEAVVEAEPVAELPTLKKATGPILKFYQKSIEKDDLKIKQKDWARYLSTYAPFAFKDLTDSSLEYPNLEAALAAEKYKQASNKPELGATLFGSHGTLHQEYISKGLEAMEEGAEIRKLSQPNEMKKKGATFDGAKWNAVKNHILMEYLAQRYASDEKFRSILEGVKTFEARLVFYTGSTATNDLGGLSKENSIEGENLYGKALMALVGFTY